MLIAWLMDLVYQSDAYEAFAGVLVNRGKRHLFQEGHILMGTETILVNWEHKKTFF